MLDTQSTPERRTQRRLVPRLLLFRQSAELEQEGVLQGRRRLLDQFPARIRQTHDDGAFVVQLAFPHDETACFEAIENPRHGSRTQAHILRQGAGQPLAFEVKLIQAQELRAAQPVLAHELAAIEVYGADDAPQRSQDLIFIICRSGPRVGCAE